jgi:hypothetical protein
MTRCRAILACLALVLATLAHAKPVRCVSGQDERLVEVVILDSKNPSGACEVRYMRKGAKSQTLWKSDWRADFCLEKSIGFVGRLIEQGFHCEETK